MVTSTSFNEVGTDMNAWKRAAALLAGTVLVLGLATACGGDDDDEDGGASAGGDTATVADGETLEVKMFDNYFRPKDITVKAGTTVTFELPNVGKLPHNMHIASLRGIYRESPWVSEPEVTNGGQTGTLVWEVPAETGTYKFRCDYHEAEMVGTVTVEP
jgi:plastocyanin